MSNRGSSEARELVRQFLLAAVASVAGLALLLLAALTRTWSLLVLGAVIASCGFYAMKTLIEGGFLSREPAIRQALDTLGIAAFAELRRLARGAPLHSRPVRSVGALGISGAALALGGTVGVIVERAQNQPENAPLREGASRFSVGQHSAIGPTGPKHEVAPRRSSEPGAQTEDGPSGRRSREPGVQTQHEPSGRADEEPVRPPVAAVVGRPPLTIAYSDWPGWVAWDIGIQKGFFVAAGVEVKLMWLEYVPSLEAFSMGRVDAVGLTNGDQLITGASGTASVAIMLNDYSNGNDMVIARPGIASVSQLRGKNVGVEVGFVSNLLLLEALTSANMTENDIRIINVPTDQTPQVLKSGSVDAVCAWQPQSWQTLSEVAGSKAIYTTSDAPGLIYDVLAVNPKSLAQRRSDWEKVVRVWFQIVDFIHDSENHADALRIMSTRVGVEPTEYERLLKGTLLLGAEGNLRHLAPGNTLASVFYSSQVVDSFNVKHDVYPVSQPVAPYLTRDIITGAAAQHLRLGSGRE
jgi:NitT/TauT family transport system substrate-binding protein